ncbi:hypothetical protein OC846_000611 [Tilletia horrida]|uniref:DUF7082 domain-containing protein n=1 Tax=Tilletia horrida TaxID=155126 RepID=A0AAN6JWS3_9BASI|nr:hypothetical protein OC846_000611 [Tilletia horrida]
MSGEGSSFGGVNDIQNHHQQHHQSLSSSNGQHGFHTSQGPYLNNAYGSYLPPHVGNLSTDSSSALSSSDVGISAFSEWNDSESRGNGPYLPLTTMILGPCPQSAIPSGSFRNGLKRPGEDLDALASGADRMSPKDRERERERERQREVSSMSLMTAARDADEQAQALRRPASFPILGPGQPGASPGYMAGTPNMGPGGPNGPSTPSHSGFMPASSSDSRFRNYSAAHSTPGSVGPAPGLSTPFTFTPRSQYDNSMGGDASGMMHTPAHAQHSYHHAQSYPHTTHGSSHPHNLHAMSTPPPPMGVPAGMPDFMRNAQGELPLDNSGAYPHPGMDNDPYHVQGRGGPGTPIQLQGPVPQPVPTIPDGAPRASLEIEGDLERQVFGWDHEEWTNGRRLLQFWRRQEGTTIHASFKSVMQREYDQPDGPRGIIVSCIFRPDKNECFITSVDLIYLLESLINNRFTVEEKNRIRRNLEGFRPMTISKNKADCSGFFKRIMGFPAPKPRNIEKDVKVFPWATLRPALCKIVGKYYASYTPGSGSNPGLAMGSDLGPPAPIGGSGTLSMGSSTSMPLGVVGVASRTPSLEQQIHRAGSGGSLRSPASVMGAALHGGSPVGGNTGSTLPGPSGLGGAPALGPGAGASGYSQSHPLALQGGSGYGPHAGDYGAQHSASSTPTPGAGPAGAFAYPDYMQSHQGYGPHSLTGTPAMGTAASRSISGSSTHPGVQGGVGLGLGSSQMGPPSSSQPGSNYVYSPSGQVPSSGAGASNSTYQNSMLGPMSGAPASSVPHMSGPQSHGMGMHGSGPTGSPAPGNSSVLLNGNSPTGGSNSGNSAGVGGSNNNNNNNGSNNSSGGANSFPVPVIGGVAGDVSNDFASGILPAPQPGRARGLSASLAGASAGGFRRM